MIILNFADSGTDQTHDDGIGTSDDETNSNSSTNSSTEQESTSPNMAQSRRVIKLDLAAMSQLLAFDEVRKIFANFWFNLQVMVVCYQNCSDLLWEKIVLKLNYRKKVFYFALIFLPWQFVLKEKFDFEKTKAT